MELTFLPTGAASTGKKRWNAFLHFGLLIFQVLCLECSARPSRQPSSPCCSDTRCQQVVECNSNIGCCESRNSDICGQEKYLDLQDKVIWTRQTGTFHVSLTIWFGLSKGRVLRRASGKSSVQTMERPLLDNMITSGVKAGSTRSAFKLSSSIKQFRIIELSKQTFEVSITVCLVLGLGGSRAQ